MIFNLSKMNISKLLYRPVSRYILALLFIKLICHSVSGQDITDSNEIPLFASNEPIELVLKFDYKGLMKGKSKDPQYQPAELIYKNPDGKEEIFNIKIKPRGITRRTTNFCAFPPLMLNFKKKAVGSTIFQNQDKLKLVAFCKNSDLYEQYNLQEYMAYKIYELLTPYSFKARLVRVTYIDTNEKQKTVTRYGFIIENEDALAERNDAKLITTPINNQDRCDRSSLDVFILFQYMIGNTDWWIPNFHNVKLLSVESKLPVPIPYDFDISGVVNTSYATPDENLNLSSVRERRFRGYCRRPGGYETYFSIFNENKESIYTMYRSNELLDERQIKSTLAYFDQFYKIINDPKLVRKNIYDACELIHKHLYE